MLAVLQGNIWHILKDVAGVSAAVKMRDACSTINIGNLSHTDFSRADTCYLLWNILKLENCRAQYFCAVHFVTWEHWMTMTVVTHYMRTHFKEGWDIRRSVERWFTVNSEFSPILPISTLQRPSQFCYVFIITVVVVTMFVVEKILMGSGHLYTTQ